MPQTLTQSLVFAVASVARFSAHADAADYLRDVKPVLSKRCYECHGALKQKGGLRLDTAASARKGGKEGSVMDPAAPEKSEMLARLTTNDEDERMPPEGERLKPEQVAAIREWIRAGANGPADEKPDQDPRQHWAFQPPVAAPVPATEPSAGGGSGGNPIDAFLAAERAKRGLRAQPPVERGILLRRVYLDLIGIPPTREELSAFLADTSPDAYERVVDRLLASPQHAERWARHWMDIWRYTDWWGLGDQLRYSQKHIWHWRDWIVDSLNEDKGYDTMVREMLAGDEIAPNDPRVLRATGFLARNYFLFNRTKWLDETIEHTGKAFLGLTLNCSKCHDHKFDPLTMKDYYRMRAVFEPHQVRLDPLPGETDLEKDGLPRVFDAHLDEKTYLHVRGDDRNADKSQVFAPGVPELLEFAKYTPKPVVLPVEAFAPQAREYVEHDQLAKADADVAAARKAIEAAKIDPAKAKPAAAKLAKQKAAPAQPASPIDELLETPTPAPVSDAADDPAAKARVALAAKKLEAAESRLVSLRAIFAAERAKHLKAPNAGELARAGALAEKRAVLLKAEENLLLAEQNVVEPPKKGSKEKVTPVKRIADARAALEKARKAVDEPGENYTVPRASLKALESPVETEAARFAPYPQTSTGRRTALAEWMTDRRNPLTARVAVNHIWMRHFAEPLVASVFDFGRRTPPPENQALLDWLAVDFMEHGWSMRRLHRLIVTSNAYRMTSSSAGAPEKNRAVDPENKFLWRMNPARMESQVVRDSVLHLAGVLDLKRGGATIPIAQTDTSRRRSLYFTHSQEDQTKFLVMFDDADVSECYRRQESVVPQQALAMSNSKLVLEMSKEIAARIEKELGKCSDAEFVRGACETILATRPTAGESAECEHALSDLRRTFDDRKLPDSERRTRASLVHVLLNHNDFVTIR